MSKGRYYFYRCYRNVLKCQKCRGAVKRLRQATEREVEAETKAICAVVEKFYRWIPE